MAAMTESDHPRFSISQQCALHFVFSCTIQRFGALWQENSNHVLGLRSAASSTSSGCTVTVFT
jgi:hypothetical protein